MIVFQRSEEVVGREGGPSGQIRRTARDGDGKKESKRKTVNMDLGLRIT